MKVLFATPKQGYTEELLFYGLTEALGTENVVDFPRFDHMWDAHKPSGLYTALSGLLEGQDEPDRNKLSERCEAGEFDLMIISNRSWNHMPMVAYNHIPCVFVDGEDDANAIFDGVPLNLGVKLYFKRELYIEDEFYKPLPFSYPESLSFAPTPAPARPELISAVFGVPHWPRQQVVQRLSEEHAGVTMMEIRADLWLSNAQYLDTLRNAKIGLDLRGFGFGTLRYWEIVASGCMLIRQKLPIRIPHDFISGLDCMEIDRLSDLQDWLRRAATDKMIQNDIRNMADLSFKRYRQFHTTKARAEQFLAKCEGVL